ncbi:hypothetical protein ACFL1X_09510 [Candidatus Hydrogenedentota bacterium]
MKLEIGRNKAVDNPTKDQIAEAIASLRAEDGSFVVLSHNENTYIQAAPDVDAGFRVQFQEGAPECFYEAANNLSTDAAIQLFQAYLNRENWKGMTGWQKLDLKSALDMIEPAENAARSSNSGCLGILLLMPATVLVGLTKYCRF